MIRTVVLGDIHGYDVLPILRAWESVDHVILLGDYLDSYDDINPIDQIANAKAIFDYVDEHPNMVTLMGNHDLHYLTTLDASTRQFKFQAYDEACLLMRNRYKEAKLPVMKQIGDVLCSHAGVTWTWYLDVMNIDHDSLEISLESLSYYPGDTSMYGADIHQSPCWVRPKWSLPPRYQNLYTFLDDDPLDDNFKYQIVGHSRCPRVFMQDNIIYCDCLSKEYVIVDQEDDGDIKIYAVDSTNHTKRTIL